MDEIAKLLPLVVMTVSAIAIAVLLCRMFGLMKKIRREPSRRAESASWREQARANNLKGEALRLALQRGNESGYDVLTQSISVRRLEPGGGAESLIIWDMTPPYVHLLLKQVPGEDRRTTRIDLRRNDESATLERSLGQLEKVPEKTWRTAGGCCTTYRGIVLEGIGKGERQEWSLEYTK